MVAWLPWEMGAGAGICFDQVGADIASRLLPSILHLNLGGGTVSVHVVIICIHGAWTSCILFFHLSLYISLLRIHEKDDTDAISYLIDWSLLC